MTNSALSVQGGLAKLAVRQSGALTAARRRLAASVQKTCTSSARADWAATRLALRTSTAQLGKRQLQACWPLTAGRRSASPPSSSSSAHSAALESSSPSPSSSASAEGEAEQTMAACSACGARQKKQPGGQTAGMLPGAGQPSLAGACQRAQRAAGGRRH